MPDPLVANITLNHVKKTDTIGAVIRLYRHVDET